MHRLLLLFLLGSLSVRLCFADLPNDAVVRITAKRSNFATSVGTGSLISADGKILTCYHVIINARDIEVVHKQNTYSSIRILSIAPDYDLAVLQILSFPAGQPFLQVSDLSPSSFSGHIAAWGYPANYSYTLRSLDIQAIDHQWTKANIFRSQGGNSSIFNNIDLDLITLRVDIESGCSGGPILSDGKIVGIIEGSWIVDAIADAWAIPVKYLNVGSEQLNVKAADVLAWRPLRLTDQGSALGRSEVGLTIPLVITLGQYGSSLGRLKKECTPLADQTPKLEAYLHEQLGKVQDGETQHGADYVASSDAALQEVLKSEKMMEMVREIVPCIDVWNQTSADGTTLNTTVNDYLGHAPLGEHSRKLFGETTELVKRVSALIERQNNADRDFIYPAKFGRWWTLTDYQRAFLRDLSILEDDTTNPAKMYQEMLLELDKYDDTVNKLIASHTSDDRRVKYSAIGGANNAGDATAVKIVAQVDRDINDALEVAQANGQKSAAHAYLLNDSLLQQEIASFNKTRETAEHAWQTQRTVDAKQAVALAYSVPTDIMTPFGEDASLRRTVSVVFSPSDHRIVTDSPKGTAVWYPNKPDPASMTKSDREALSLPHGGHVYGTPVFSPNGQFIVVRELHGNASMTPPDEFLDAWDVKARPPRLVTSEALGGNFCFLQHMIPLAVSKNLLVAVTRRPAENEYACEVAVAGLDSSSVHKPTRIDPPKRKNDTAHPFGPRDLEFSPDQKLLATIWSDGTLQVSNPRTGEQIKEVSGPQTASSGGILPKVQFSADGKYLLHIGSPDGTALIWNTADWRLKCTIHAGIIRHGIESFVMSAGFSPKSDSHIVLTTSWERLNGQDAWRATTLWNAENCKEVRSVDSGPSVIESAFSSDGRLIFEYRTALGTKVYDLSSDKSTELKPICVFLSSRPPPTIPLRGTVLALDANYSLADTECGWLVYRVITVGDVEAIFH